MGNTIMKDVIHASESFEATVIRHWEKLLDMATRLLDEKNFGLAVVVAQSACEVVTERAITKAFAEKGLMYLEEPVTSLLSTYSLNSEKTRRLYDALTGDNISSKPFWVAYKKLVAHRNDVVHAGKEVGTDDSRLAVETGKVFVSHIARYNGLE